MVEGFDRYATSYDHALARGLAVSGEGRHFFARGRISWLATGLRHLGHEPRGILDFGCGDGESTALLLRSFAPAHVVGTDVSEALLARARQEHAGPCFLPVKELPAEGRFDLVYCNGVFHHIRPEEQPVAVQFIRERLEAGGLLCLWENNPWNPGARYVMSRIPFDRDAVMVWPRRARELLRAGGFDVLRTDFRFVFPRPLRLLRFLESPLSSLPFGAQYQVLARKRLASVDRVSLDPEVRRLMEA